MVSPVQNGMFMLYSIPEATPKRGLLSAPERPFQAGGQGLNPRKGAVPYEKLRASLHRPSRP